MNPVNHSTFDKGTAQWEEGSLGCDEAYAAVVPKSNVVDEALGLQMISIRLPKELIETFKFLANDHGMGYQPLMRTTLQRFADSELKLLGRAYMDKLAADKQIKQMVEPNAQKDAQGLTA